MQIEISIIAILIFIVMTYNGQLSIKEFINDHFHVFRKLKEDDWDFYVKAKYGDAANPDNLYIKRNEKAL